MEKVKAMTDEDVVKETITAYARRLEKQIKEKIQREIRAAFRNEDIIKALVENHNKRTILSHKKIFALTERKLQSICNDFKKILKTNKIIEETMCNVLVAIQQNEYLQAYYPEQCGYPAQKVVGLHPVQQERHSK